MLQGIKGRQQCPSDPLETENLSQEVELTPLILLKKKKNVMIVIDFLEYIVDYRLQKFSHRKMRKATHRRQKLIWSWKLGEKLDL